MKCGPHILQPTAEALTWAARASIVKSIDNPGSLLAARPDAITIFRAYVDLQRQDVIGPREFFDLTLHRLAGFRPTYIEGLNEHAQHIATGLADYIEWTRRYTEIAHSAGYKVAGFGFSTGNPEYEDWLALRDAGFAGVDALSIHEYWGNAGFTGWNALRCLTVHEWLNGQHPPCIITECGRDAIDGEGTAGQRGWKTQGVDAIAYADEILAYGRAIEPHPFILGATPFSSGTPPDWADFSLDEITYYLIEALAAQDEPGGTPMDDPRIQQLLDQNRILTECWKAFRQGKFTGADGIDGRIVEMQGGAPLDFEPSYPSLP